MVGRQDSQEALTAGVPEGSAAGDPIQQRLEQTAVPDAEVATADGERHVHPRPRWRAIALAVVGVATVLFHFYTAGAGPLTSFRQTSVHVLVATTMCLLNNWDGKGAPGSTRARWAGVLALTHLAVIVTGTVYVLANFQRIAFEFGYARPSTADIVLGTLVLLTLFAAARRTIGWAFPIITGVLFAYGLWGHNAPGVLSHAPMSYTDLIADGFISPLGIFGAITATAATDIAIFIILGGLLMATGGGDGFLKLALVIAGRRRGGPGKVVVVSSALFGMINGSAVANTASTGSITIPMMKRYGFKPRFAAGIEAAASTGGQWTPPIMGAVVFLMAQLLSIPFYQLAAAAIIPALIFYIAFFTTVHTEANKHGLVGIPRDQIPRIKEFADELVILFPPVLVLIYMIIERYPVRIAGFSAVVTLLVAATLVQLFWKRTSLRTYGQMFVTGCVQAASTIGVIGVLVAGSQVIVAVVGTTALGLNLGQLIFQFATVSLFGALVMAAIINIVLGLSLPTVPSYLIAIAITSAALQNLGMEPIAVHFFALYFATLGGLTPPIGATAFVAAAIAGTGWLGVSLTAMRLCAIAFVMPFIFAVRPELLLVGDAMSIAEVAVTTTAGAVALSVAMTGYGSRRLRPWEIVLLGASALALLLPGTFTNVIGAVGVAVIIALHRIIRDGPAPPATDKTRELDPAH